MERTELELSNCNVSTLPTAIQVQTATISKNALKRERRTALWQEKKQAMKRHKKEQQQIRRTLLIEASNSSTAALIENASSDNNTDYKVVGAEVLEARRQRAAAQKKEFLDRCNQCYSVVIDCNFESAHNEKTTQSLGNQLAYCHSVNKKCAYPSRLFITGVGPKLMSRLALTPYINWTGVSVHHEEFTAIEELKGKHLVYLTADSENLIEELDPSAAYIIGGIVDRNRLKGVTLEKANEMKISHARLPIRENIKLSSSQVIYCCLNYSNSNILSNASNLNSWTIIQVLTVNHVYEILKKFSEVRNWRLALTHVIPERKTDNESSSGSDEEKITAAADGGSSSSG
jgi:tRNA (guanine9-N1)-methyltransferase